LCVDHSPFVGADTDRALILIDDLYVEQQLPTVANFPESSARNAPRALRSGTDVFDADLEPHGRLALG
jgi:hypothetical protein